MTGGSKLFRRKITQALTKLALQRTTTPAEGEQTLTLFPRSNPSFQEYFVTEVLDLQPEPVQHFLLQTSILNRLTGSLCDAVAEQQNSQDMLTMLEIGRASCRERV